MNDEMLDWLLGSLHGAGEGSDTDGHDTVSYSPPLMKPISHSGCHHSFAMPVPSDQVSPPATMNELGVDLPMFPHSYMLAPSLIGRPESSVFRVDLTSNIPCAGRDERDSRQPLKEKVKLDEAKQATDVRESTTSSGNERRRKQRRDAEKHNAAEKERRGRLKKKIKTLQSLIPNSNKVDIASILGEAIEYLKSLKLHINELLVRSMTCANPLGASTSQLQYLLQHPQFGPMGLGINKGMCIGDGKPTMASSSSALLTHAMPHSSLSSASTMPWLHVMPYLPRPALQLPFASVSQQYGGFCPPCMLASLTANRPTWFQGQQLPVPSQPMEEDYTGNQEANN